MKKILVITANFGGIDNIKEIPKQTIEFDRVYITEKNSPYDFAGLDNRLRAKYFKWQMHKLYPEYDVFIWVDGNVQIKVPEFFANMVDRLQGYDIVMSHHPERNCIYKEAEFIMKGVRENNPYLKTRYNDSIQNEVDFFRSQGHPKEAGLYWCGLFAVRNDSDTNKVFDEVWNDNILRSNFDQNSFAYHVYRNDLRIKTVNWGNFHRNNSYELIHHSKLM